jgi:biotin carboxylase
VSTLIVLGAASGSLSTYRIARMMGYRTVCVDRSPSAPGVALADEFLQLSTREAMLVVDAMAGRDDLVGVLAPSSDIALPSVRTVADRLGLPSVVSEPAARASVDKPFFRGLCDRLGLPSYRWVEGSDLADVVDRALDLRYPVVVKPTDAQSARGAYRCADPAAVAAAVPQAHRFSYQGSVMVEEEVAGTHAGCECIVDDGRVVFAAVTERALTPPPLPITTAHLMPADLPPEVHDSLTDQLDTLCAALGYQRGPLNVDVVLSPEGQPHVIEMGARTGGNGLDDLVRYSYGVDVIRASIQAAVGEPIEISRREPAPVMWQALWVDRSGELATVTGLAEAMAIPEVMRLELLVEPGQQVRQFDTVANQVGYAVLAGGSAAALREASERLRKTVQFEVTGRDATPDRLSRLA